MVISLGLGTIIAVGLAGHLNALREAARNVAEGRFDTRVEVPSGDELSELANAFNRMSAELGTSFARERAVEQGRRDLVAAISHDLRTPMASIRAMLEAIEDGVVSDPATVHQYHVAMREQVNRLNRLIDDLFELSRFDSGSLEPRVSAVDLNELVAETVDSLRPSAEQKGVDLLVEPGCRLVIRFRGRGSGPEGAGQPGPQCHTAYPPGRQYPRGRASQPEGVGSRGRRLRRGNRRR